MEYYLISGVDCSERDINEKEKDKKQSYNYNKKTSGGRKC